MGKRNCKILLYLIVGCILETVIICFTFYYGTNYEKRGISYSESYYNFADCVYRIYDRRGWLIETLPECRRTDYMEWYTDDILCIQLLSGVGLCNYYNISTREISPRYMLVAGIHGDYIAFPDDSNVFVIRDIFNQDRYYEIDRDFSDMWTSVQDFCFIDNHTIYIQYYAGDERIKTEERIIIPTMKGF